MKNITAPEFDNLISILENNSFNPQRYDKKTREKILALYKLLDCIKPIKEDELKIMYFSLERGTIKNYGDYEELKQIGEVSSYDEFVELYEEEYSSDIYWYRLVTTRYKNYYAISINNKNVIYADVESDLSMFENRQLHKLLDALILKVKEIIEMLKANKYNEYIVNNLSHKKRFGVIKRSDYWKIYPEIKNSLLDEITEKEIDYFIKYASENTDERIKDMTSNQYFEAVRLAYQSNDYEIDGLSDKELYLKYADGRDEGLSKINPNSSEEFDAWYKDENRFGGHPWEIMRGHSFSRVNLYICHDEKGYYLSLDGSRILRKIEIVKIYLALKENNIPIQIYDVDIIKDALKGNDYIGIVPDYIIPIECGSYFNDYKPKEFTRISDEKVFDDIIWQEVEKLYLK